MIKRGLVVVGAEGALGKGFLAAAEARCDLVYRLDLALADGVIACDLRDEQQIRSALETLPISRADFWHLLVTSGYYAGSGPTSLAWPELKESLQANLIGVTLLAARFVELVREHDARARIVLVSSAAARVGSQDIGYGVAKAGIEGLVRSLSKSYAKLGISTIGLAPGIFASRMSEQQNPERARAAIEATHIKRMAELQDIVKCALFLAFDAPDSLTGTFVSPNGGQI